MLSPAITLMAPIIVAFGGRRGCCVAVAPDDCYAHRNGSDHDEEGHQANESGFDFQSLKSISREHQTYKGIK